jgi:hypothetical protein
MTVLAADFSFNAFGTVGYAISDQGDFRYLRYIDDKGTFKVDSLLGAQFEVRFNPEWSATVQVVGSAPRRRDDGVEAAVRWAFVSFRPTNDWLIRGGRLRPPVFIHTQNAEVGVTYDQARLPVEIYSLSPVYDVDGAAVAKTWLLDKAEINLEAYWGTADVKFRLPFLPPERRLFFQGTHFQEDVTFRGAVLSYSAGPLFLRGGFHAARIRGETPINETFVPVAFPGGALYLPGGSVDVLHAQLLTFGVDWRSGNWRATGEIARRSFKETVAAVDSNSAYVTVAHALGKWTPYVTYARVLSDSGARRLHQEIKSTPVPPGLVGMTLPGLGVVTPDFNRITSFGIQAQDQYSTMLGASYSFSPTAKLKLEWMRTKVGVASTLLVDGDVSNRHFNVYSLSYSMAF